MKIGDAAADVHINLAAPDQHLAQLLPPALDPGLHARQRNADVARRLCLRQTPERCQFDGRPVRLRQASDHGSQTRREFLLIAHGGRVGHCRQIDFQRIRAAVFTLACTQGVPERIPRNLKEPGLRPIRRTQGTQCRTTRRKTS